MRLLSAIVRNYRIHREVSIDFDASLNLVGGKNESGKSTLAEAIHRALFLKSTTGGKVQESMQSDLHPGHPEVEVSFVAGGKTWELKKVFSKASGKATLSEQGGSTLHGADAEARVAELMQVEEAGGGTGGAKKSQSQWSHLWVWQGSGGEDPSDHASDQRDALLSRLKEQGGGAVMQSDLDARVARQLQSFFEDTFTKTGQPKAGSELAESMKRLESAVQDYETAESEMQKLRGAVNNFEEAQSTLLSGESRLAELKEKLELAEKKSKRIIELQHQVEWEERSHKEAEEKEAHFSEAIGEIRKLRAELEESAAETNPRKERLKGLEELEALTRKNWESKSGEIEKGELALSALRDQKELAEAWGHLLKNRARKSELEETLQEIELLETQRKETEDQLASIPPVDESVYQELQQLRAATSEAAAVLEAMSTEVEIIRSDRDITMGGNPLSVGTREVIHEETSLKMGEEIEIRICPGGGNDLEEAREQARSSRTALTSALRKVGTESVEEAREIRNQRITLESRKKEIDSGLKARRPQDLRSQLDEAKREIIRYEAEVERRSPRVPDFTPPADFPAARSAWEKVKEQFEPIEESLRATRQSATELRASLNETTEKRALLQQSLEDLEKLRIEKTALLEAKENPLGDAESQEEKRAALSREREEAARKLATSRESLAALEPESITADLERFQRALENQKEALNNAGQKKAVASSILERDGSTDPNSNLEQARTTAESARERENSLRLRAEAIRLLRDSFAEEQQRLSDQFSQPLAEKVSGYLQQIFGSNASATVSVSDGAIGEWRMTRETGTFDFADLSGGTREQVAAAVRLAVAEILAADHGGHLPLVFDDAFTNSDPRRIESLQRMLDLASSRGLQIILLTCTPDDYVSLGAKTISLEAKYA